MSDLIREYGLGNERRSARLAAVNALEEEKDEERVSVVELDDEETTTTVPRPFVVRIYGEYGVVNEKKETRVDDFVTTSYKVEFLDWPLTHRRQSARLSGDVEFVEEDYFERVVDYRTDKETYWVIALRKKCAIINIMRRDNAALVGKLETGANFIMDHLMTKVANSYFDLSFVQWRHHTLRRRVDCCKALLPYVSKIILSRAGTNHDGIELWDNGPADLRGLFKSIRMRNDAAARVFGDDAVVRGLDDDFLCIYNVVLMWRRVSDVPMLEARYDVFGRHENGHRFSILHHEPTWES